ncbi:hypothetical protein ACSQ67_025494 [Phaseolus vulgaris]
MLVVSAIAAGLNNAFLLTISFHDPSPSPITGSSKSLIPYIKDNIERSVFVSTGNSGMEIALDLANFGTKASIVARTSLVIACCTLFDCSIFQNAQPDDKLKAALIENFLHTRCEPTTTKDDSVEKLAPRVAFELFLALEKICFASSTLTTTGDLSRQ